MKRILLLLILVFGVCSQAHSATYYLRGDGGTNIQCDGTANVAYDGSGTGEACAFNQFFYAVGAKNNNPVSGVMVGGDTLIINNDVAYKVGHIAGVFDSGNCNSAYPWDCYANAIPSGTALNPTKIYGTNYATCSGVADASIIMGVERTQRTFNLEGSDYIDIKCITITDGEECGESHPKSSLTCERNTFPYGDWSPNGIYALDSENVTADHLYVHGMGGTAVRAGRIQDWDITNFYFGDSPQAAWDADFGDPDDWADAGTLSFENGEITRAGCVGTFPFIALGGVADDSCYTQGQGNGYGDGIGFSRGGALDSSDVTVKFTNVKFHKNTSDGLDALYFGEKAGETSVIMNRVRSESNTGDAIKIDADYVKITDSIITANGGFYSGRDETYTDIGFTHCRAGCSALSLSTTTPGSEYYIEGSTINGQGDVLVITGGDDGGCDGSEVFQFRNNIFVGATQWGGGDTTDDFYAAGDVNGNGGGSCGSSTVYDIDGTNIIFGTKTADASAVNSDPLLTEAIPNYPTVGHPATFFDFNIASGSPARGLRNASFGGSTDYNDFVRVNAIGGLEFGSVATDSGGGATPNKVWVGIFFGVL